MTIPKRRKKDVELRALIVQSFEQSRNTYGSPRVRLDLRELGHRCGKNRVARLMRDSGLRARQKRHRDIWELLDRRASRQDETLHDKLLAHIARAGWS